MKKISGDKKSPRETTGTWLGSGWPGGIAGGILNRRISEGFHGR
jgi:hypothetical protein